MECKDKMIFVLIALLLFSLVPVVNAETSGYAERVISQDVVQPGEKVKITIKPHNFDNFYAVRENLGELTYTGENTADSNPEGTTFTMLTAKKFTYQVKVPEDAKPGDKFVIDGEFWNDPNDKEKVKGESTIRIPKEVKTRVAVLVLNHNKPSNVEDGMISLLEDLGYSPVVIGVKQVENGEVSLSDYKLIVVPTYSLAIDSALESNKVRDAIIDATNSGTNWILFNSGCKVLEVLDLATVKVNSPPGWVPALPDSYYVVKATTDSPITSGVPSMPDWPGGYSLKELDNLYLDPLIWRVDNTENSRYKWLHIDDISKEPTYLIYEGSTGWHIGKPHKALPEWTVGDSHILFYHHFWNADPGNGGGGKIGPAGKAILKNAVNYYAEKQSKKEVFTDEFNKLSTSKWIKFGSPSPKVFGSVKGRSGIFDNNGDSWCSSGVITRDALSLTPPLTIESDMYLDLQDKSGCWAGAGFSLYESNEYHNSGSCANDMRGLGRILSMGIGYEGDACWATPKEYRRHAYLGFGFITENGEWDAGPTEGYGNLQRDDLIDGWHTYKVKVDKQGYVSFYVDNELIYKSSEKIDLSKLENCYLWLGSRSSGSAGKAYHDYIKIERTPTVDAPSAPQNLQATSGDNKVALTWHAPSDNGGSSITSYKVYRGTGAGKSVVAIVKDTSYTDTGLTNGQTYYYQVSAVNSAGEGSLSSKVSATPTEGGTSIVSTEDVSVSEGKTATTQVILDEVPSGGLSYANLTVDIANSTVAQIQDVSFPDWATLSQNSSMPSSTIWFKVGDLSDNVGAGDTDVTLATVTVEGLHNGTSNIELTVNSFQAENYSEIGDSIATKLGEVKVGVSGPPQIGGKQPKDPDGNGLYEDVDGDNNFNFGDVIFFFQKFGSDPVKNNKQFYDFNRDGAINFGDVVALFNTL